MNRSRRKVARVAAAWAVAGYVACTVAALAAIEVIRPELRDEEYGRRLTALRSRIAEHPGRPLVVVIGSSRAAMDVCPRVWEETRPGNPDEPLIFNMSRVGGGPLLNLMTLRRLYADGIRPAAVLLEYWPPLLHQEGPFREADRIDPDRLARCDRSFVREYLHDADRIEWEMLEARLNPIFSQRTTWLRAAVPRWLPRAIRFDPAVKPLDVWGWLPGMDRPALAWEPRERRLAACERIYRPHLAGWRVSPEADRATREAIAMARNNGATAALVFFPESEEFRSWYSPEVAESQDRYRESLQRELAVQVLDTRTWLSNDRLADGFHATRAGAEEFTRRFAPAVVSIFANSRCR